MKGWERENITRLALALLILLSGLALIPFIDIPADAITWELLAQVYEPTLAVYEDSGAPSSIFANHRANMAAPISHARFYLGLLIKALST